MKIVLIAVACFCLSLLSYGNADSAQSCNLTSESCYSTNAVVCQNGSCSNGMVLRSVSYEGGAVKIQYNSSVFNGIARPQLPYFSVLNICEEKSMSLTSSDLICSGNCETTFINSLPRTEWFKVTCDTKTDLKFVRDTRMWKIVFFNSSCKPDVPNFFVLVDTREVNECDNTSKHNCPQNAECVDEECGYSCQCNDGYQLASDNSTCLYVTLELQVEQTVVREDVGMLNVYVVVRSNMLEENTNHSITVNVSTIPESAQESGRETPDYRLVQKSITLTSLSPGNSSAVSIEIVDDNRKESNETFSIHLNTSDPGVFIKVSNVRVTIIDNDLIGACPSDVDVRNIKWKTANVSSTSKAPCPHQGVATRFCNSEGKWEDTVYDNCTSDRLSIIENNAKSLTENKNLTAMERKNMLNDIVVDLINETNASLVPPSLQSIIRSLESVTDTLEQINSTDERVIEIFNNLLDQSQYEGWTNLQKDGHLNGSEILLDNAERYAKTLTTSPDQKLPVTLSRSNIVVNGREYSDPPSTDIVFPSNSDMVNYTTNRNFASIKIPPSLIKDNLQDDKKVPVSFVLFRYVPTTTSFVNESTSAASSVISAQVGRTSIPFQSSALVADPVILNFGFDEIGNTSSYYYVCVFWNFSEPIGSGGWITDGVNTQCVSESGNQTNVMCTSTHLTSFAVLVDITGALGKASKAERVALNIVSYIGCGVSIVCLLITVLFFLYQGKRLFEKVHHFVHLNLALSLLMANVLFVSGVQVAAKDEIACKVIAALLHYLFLTAFCWMLCEGIMLYLLLVVVFGNMANKLWLFMIIGYVLPLPIVIVTAAVRYPYYGVTDECGNLLYCWLSSEEGTIYGFVAPMLAVIVVNVLFLLIALRVLWKSKRQQLNRSKENTTVTMKTARAVLLASVVLLPLLGVTWTFGILNVNQHTTAFAWLFTIFNSLQGAFIFFFHVIRSEPVQNKIGSRIKTMTGTLRSRYTVSSRWFSSENTSTVIVRNTTRNGNHSTCATDDVVVMDEEPKVVDEPPEVKDPTPPPPPPPEKTSHVYRYQSETISEPGMEYVLADGTVGTEKQIELNTHKLTVLKINQLLRRTRKLLATHQESPEEIKMETPVKLTNGTTETDTADDVFTDPSNV